MELKLCPFCGGRPRLVFNGNQWSNRWRGVIAIKCICGALVSGGFYDGPPIELPLEDTVGGDTATQRWNRRTKE